jgi:hypothetical protein
MQAQIVVRNFLKHDPFNANKTVSVRAIGDLQSDIGTIFIDLKYVDAK